MSDNLLSRRGLGLIGASAVAAAIATPIAAQPRRPMARGDWFDMIREHHRDIDVTFREIMATRDRQVPRRRALQMRLMNQLAAHSGAEEAAVYPHVHDMLNRPQADELYTEQDMARVFLARLEMLEPSSPDWMRTMRELEAAIREHVAEEENDVYPALQRRAGSMNAMITAGYAREYAKYRQV